jgi:hypothetical protein
MANLTRRSFMKLGIASGALLAAAEGILSPALVGAVKLKKGGKDFNFKCNQVCSHGLCGGWQTGQNGIQS